MIALLQRVSEASVIVNEKTVGAIDVGMLIFMAVQKQDNEKSADQMLQRILSYRMFADENNKMNKDIMEIDGGILLVPQFTLAANTNKGLRPNFSAAADSEHGKQLFDYFLDKLKKEYDKVESGIFAADMQVHLVNDGPVTFWLEL